MIHLPHRASGSEPLYLRFSAPTGPTALGQDQVRTNCQSSFLCFKVFTIVKFKIYESLILDIGFNCALSSHDMSKTNLGVIETSRKWKDIHYLSWFRIFSTRVSMFSTILQPLPSLTQGFRWACSATCFSDCSWAASQNLKPYSWQPVPNTNHMKWIW